MALDLSADRALIFRITHMNNVPWILRHGLHCQTAAVIDPNFVAIGSAGLIDRRTTREIAMRPGGTLSDYVPFYFTPITPMMLNIVTGRGVPQRAASDIAILVTSLHKLRDTGRRFIFSDRHAYLRTATFFDRIEDLTAIPWDHLNRRDFRRNAESPEIFDRYQAEALVHSHVPIESILGFGCQDVRAESTLGSFVAQAGSALRVVRKPDWYC
jgi:hypothetical protein